MLASRVLRCLIEGAEVLLQLLVDFSPQQSVPCPGRPRASHVARRGTNTEGSEG